MTLSEREARRRLIVERELVRRDAARARARAIAADESDAADRSPDAELDDLPASLVG